MTFVIYVPVAGPISVGPVMDINKYVGGYAEWVSLTPDLGMMVAEHGKVGPYNTPPYASQPQNFYRPNIRGTWLFSTFRGFDWIVGPAVIMGAPYFKEGDELDDVTPATNSIFNIFATYCGSGVCDWCESTNFDLAFDLNIKFNERRLWGFTCSQCAVDSMRGSRPRLGTGYGQIMVPLGELDKLGKVEEE